MSLTEFKAKIKYVPDRQTETNYQILRKILRRVILASELEQLKEEKEKKTIEKGSPK